MKKILTVVAALALAFSLMGCVVDDQGVNWNTYTKDKQGLIAYYAQIAANKTLNGSWYIPDTVFFAPSDDDPKDAIKGNDNNYTVSLANTESDLVRAYEVTAFKHAGALIKVTFDSADVGTSKMGVIFDLKDDDEHDGAKEFYIIGLNPQTTVKNFYVSKFENVTDIQADNFGTYLTSNKAIEKEIVPISMTNNITVPAAVDGKISFYVYYKLMSDGSFDYAVLDMTDEDMANFKGSTKFNKAKIKDYTVLASGNTKAKAGAEYPAYEAKK